MARDPLNRFLDRFLWVAVFVIVFVVLGSLVTGDFPLPAAAEPKYLVIDISSTLIVCAAAIAVTITQFFYVDHGTLLGRAARWLAMLGLWVMSVRWVYLLVVVGDVPVTPVSVAAVGAIALGIFLRCVAIWERCRDRASKLDRT